MRLKESEARQKYCCRFRDFDKSPDMCYCWGSQCMAWVDAGLSSREGYCGFITKHN